MTSDTQQHPHPPRKAPKQAKTKSINLALQGGGSHGAFTWGVLDRLLEDERITIEGISGTSAGAMNAVVLADGLHKSGREGGRTALRAFWKAASRTAGISLLQRTPWDRFTGNWSLNASPGYMMLDLVSRFASPYELNPFNINPILDFLRAHIDFDAVQCCAGIKLFIPATNVRTGRVRVFTNQELSPEAVMASACLPQLFPAVEIDGEAYWDGGYTGNPALHPLIYQCDARDIVIVQINPIDSPELPRTSREIQDRVNEITFNSSLLAELRAIRFVARQLEAGHLDPAQYKRMLMHRIAGEEELKAMDASSKLNTEWKFLQTLHDGGRRAADAWLETHFDQIGVDSTLDLAAMFT
ncbi:patatin-like phospholipase family protein [Pusillimonas sp. TS35]|uniref:patatin-like phospholipase family protein n=1 Tax=Paracandidimonas lactea TaxID=2895524 RepID=UPI00137084B6|nr:patatin-like phospholipase family protein [Paracandidimonas lactea]MYN15066.1 patatin-like phospholipase family protein [Pusillimonas sp. TS35]